MSAAAPLLSAAIGPLSRSTSGVVARVSRAFHIFRIDGYSWSTTLPGGEGVRSSFTAGGRDWSLGYYPNGADASTPDSGHISLYLRLDEHEDRVRAQFRFSLLDPAAAYGLPAATAVFMGPTRYNYYDDDDRREYYYDDYIDEDGNEKDPPEELGFGYAEFVAKEELERRRDSLLRDDSLAIRCDVAVLEFGHRSWQIA
ncbi:unnamed protein product [Urochloa decumbens]|uniref:MATH domain-containing protein n=1 Tax=Urochloa decumbens TaxID=240449 RepID=A0ABC9BXZ6_9POAL